MQYAPTKLMRMLDQYHHRRSIRIKDYDYSQSGAYFVTICTFNRDLIFEDSIFKKIVENEWENTMAIRPNIAIDEFVVMPNHVHGIIIISESTVGANCRSPFLRGVCNTPLQKKHKYQINLPQSPSQTIGAIIRGFKSSTAQKINMVRNTRGLHVWQRNYYEHVIRNERDLFAMRKYIVENPIKWELDEDNPNNIDKSSVGAN